MVDDTLISALFANVGASVNLLPFKKVVGKRAPHLKLYLSGKFHWYVGKKKWVIIGEMLHLHILQAGLWFAVFLCLTFQGGRPHKFFMRNVGRKKLCGERAENIKRILSSESGNTLRRIDFIDFLS